MKKGKILEGATLATFHNEIDRYCRRFGIDHARTLERLLDMMIHFFEWDTESPQHRENFRTPEEETELDNLMCVFFQTLYGELSKRKWVDLFGDYFMEYGANVKDRGQCFTPDCVCDVMARLSLGINEGKDLDDMRQYVPGFGQNVVINDCACGSARLLLAGGATYRDITHRNDVYLVASDIDDRCCKQSAINILAHGFYGEVACMDTLMGESSFSHGWIINQGLYPIPFGLPTLTYTTDKSKFFQYQRNIIGNPPFEESNNASK